jgi:hypothetical protein
VISFEQLQRLLLESVWGPILIIVVGTLFQAAEFNDWLPPDGPASYYVIIVGVYLACHCLNAKPLTGHKVVAAGVVISVLGPFLSGITFNQITIPYIKTFICDGLSMLFFLLAFYPFISRISETVPKRFSKWLFWCALISAMFTILSALVRIRFPALH